MKTVSVLGCIAACSIAIAAAAVAQTAAPAALPSASASTPGKNIPRPLSPAEKRDSASPPGEMRPVDAVIPQINVPLGRAAASESPLKPGSQRQRAVQAGGGIDDSVAQCKAQTTRAARAECLDRIAHAKPAR